VDLVGVVTDGGSTNEASPVRQNLSSAVAELHPISSRVNKFVLSGHPANNIVDFSVRAEADLIIMASHARGGLMRRLLGSVTTDVLRRTSIPVMVTKPHHEAYFLDRVIVALDGTEVGMAAVRHASELARLVDVPLGVLHVIESLSPEETKLTTERIENELTDVSIEYELILETGSPKERLVSFTDAMPGSVLVMGSAGATGFGPNRRNSVATYVIEKSSSPTLVVPPTGYLGAALE
jgi:nucleotide-binding universal stress UspA family protein